MKLSLFTTVTNPEPRGDPHKQAMACFKGLADEVIEVDGTKTSTTYSRGIFKRVYHEWPQEFEWSLIGQQFQRGYEACTGDWVLRMDLDMIIHEDDYDKIRNVISDNPHAPAVSLWKYQFIQPDRYILKSRLVVLVNRGEYGDRIRFDGGGDLCQPTLDGELLEPDDVPEARLPIYNYECILKNKKQILEDKGRMARAWQKTFGDYKLGGPDDESAYGKWEQMLVGRNNKAQQHLAIKDHPKVMRNTIKELKPENFGYDGFGNFRKADYF